jgi:hypothetical protein
VVERAFDSLTGSIGDADRRMTRCDDGTDVDAQYDGHYDGRVRVHARHRGLGMGPVHVRVTAEVPRLSSRQLVPARSDGDRGVGGDGVLYLPSQ